MPLGWLLSLAPAADDIFNSIKNVLGKDKKKDQLIKDISEKFTTLYATSIKGLQRDVALISGWKPVVARLQGIEASTRSWEIVLGLARSEDNVPLALKVITSKRVEMLAEEISKVSDTLQQVAATGAINWTEGGADVEGESKRMVTDAELLLKVIKQFEETIAAKKEVDEEDLFFVDSTLGNMRGRMITVVTYYDNFLRELALNASQAPQHFQKGIVGLVPDAINAKFDTTSWSDILKKVYDAVNK